MINQISLEPLKFKEIRQLLVESRKIYCSKIKTLLAITALPVGFSVVPFLVSIPFYETYKYWFLIFAIFWLISFFLQLWAIPSLLCCLKENVGFLKSYQEGLKIFKSYLWVYFLVFIITLGGFLLFIIPGILFSVWFILTVYVLIFEEKRGMGALKRSKELVSGRWWGVFWRFLIFGLIIAIIGIIIYISISFLVKVLIDEEMVNLIIDITKNLLQLFITPIFLIYGSLIYKNLAEIEKEIPSGEPLQKRKYILPGILGFLIFAIIFGFAFLNIFLGRDEPFPNDSDLWLPAIEIPKEENAFYYFVPYFSQSEKEAILRYLPEEKERLEETKEIYWPREKTELINSIIKGEEWDEKLAEDLIKNNSQVLIDFEKATKCSYFQVPIYQNPKNIDATTFLFSTGEFRNIAKLNLVKAIYLFKQGEEKEAFDEIIKTIQFGHLIENSQGGLIYYLTGIAIKDIGLEKLRLIISETNLSPEILSSYIEKLEKFKENEEGLVKVFKMGYIEFSNTKARFIDPIIKGKISKEKMQDVDLYEISEFPTYLEVIGRLNYFYKPNQTQRLFAEYFRTNVDNASKIYCKEMKSPEIKPLVPYSKIKMLFTENLIGKILHDMTIVSLGSVHSKKCLEDFSISAAQTLIALKSYKIENGELSNSLDELSPKYISEIPKDSFDGNSIRYSKEKQIIYSLGHDLEDSGGNKGENWREMNDPTFEIKF